MASGLRMKIVSPAGTRFDGEVMYASLPGAMGEFTVLPFHAPIVSVLEKGEVKYATPDNAVHRFAIGGGFAEVRGNVITVCIEEQKQ